MASRIVQTSEKVTLVGAGPVKTGILKEALTLAPFCVAVDGGAEMAQKYGSLPKLVIGDMDSADSAKLAGIPAERILHIPEQETTDFDKALRVVESPLILGVGFTGGRIDHMLSNFSTLLKFPDKPVILISKREIFFHLSHPFQADLPPGSRVSVYPLQPARARSTGLKWPLDPHEFAPGGMLGTSNRVTEGPVTITPEGPGLLAILPCQALPVVAGALTRSRQIT